MKLVPPCSLSGTVRDSNGAVLPGASVRVIDATTGAEQALVSDKAGHYCATGLAPGKYSVVFQRAAFRELRLDAVTVVAGQATEANAVLKIDITANTHPPQSHPQPPPPPPSPPSVLPSPVEPTPAEPIVIKRPPPVPGPKPGVDKPPVPQNVEESTQPVSLGEAEAKWFDQLKSGSIDYHVPGEMVIGKPSEVWVTVYGYKAPAPAPQADGSAPEPLKVSDYMRVTISQDDNPDEFTIVHGDNADAQFVPINSNTTWKWTVTPKHLGQGMKLQFQAYVIYSDPAKGVQQAFPSTSKVVTVQAEGVTGIATQARDNFWLQPLNWFKYMLPGGAGFAAIVAVISWWNKRRKKPEAAAAETAKVETAKKG